ncbi:MAG: signal recognition particle protein [Alphaproteobacteria bacterium]|nr:signal recognition particle protein [Alphaproteobacteria bacterium]|tara:strand:+ start:336914 stop:338530 length:1617 start_codon:yes stop_codon:yes gene_type:complete
MFKSLSDRLGGIFEKLGKGGRLSENDVTAAMREIRIALLEADVALPVVKEFIEKVKAEAVGQDVIKAVSPAQQVVKIVNDAMIDMLGAGETELNLNAKPPVVYLMVGLQGAGKTTSTAKIAHWLREKSRKKVLMASLDVQRPAAQEQLATLGEQTETATLEIIKGQSPLEITKRALETARLEGYDVLMLDTAGRLAIDEELMDEVAAVKKLAEPTETLLVADAMTGQDAVNTAKAFDDKMGITGIMLTRVDGDARGGAAMSMLGVTGKPVKLIGTGEKWTEIDAFHPDRIVSRILGMGDVVSLVEKAVETMDQAKAEEMAKKFKKGQFDFNDMLDQFQQMKKMGGMGSMLKLLPGISKFADQIDQANMDDTVLKKQEAIIQSMTKDERAKPSLLNASRKKRIAAGSGSTVPEVNRLIKQHQQMEKAMKRLKKMGMGGMMKQMKSLMGGKDAAMMDAMQGMDMGNVDMNDPEAIKQFMAEMDGDGANMNAPASPLGANPFTSGAGAGLPGLGGGMGGGMPGLGGMSHGGTKKNRKKKKR